MAGISARDRDIAIRNILAEAMNQGDAGMEAVAQVMENRLTSGKYGDTLSDVVLQPGQFSAWNGITGYNGGKGANDLVSRDWSSGEDNQRYYEKAAAALDRVFGSSGDPTGGAVNYYNPDYANPSWGRNAPGTMIGDHKFLSLSKPTPLTPQGNGYMDYSPSAPMGTTSFSSGTPSVWESGGGLFGDLLRGGASALQALPGATSSAADAINGAVQGSQPLIGKVETAVRDKVMENPIGALFNLGPFAGLFNGKGMGFGQSAAQQTAALAARSAANIKAAEGTGRRPITYSPHLSNRTPGSGITVGNSERGDNTNDIAFMPRSVQESSRWNTGY